MKKYDLIFGLGNACSCTQTLREAKLQYLSFPFDWVIMDGENDLARRIDTIAGGFVGWLEKKDLVRIGSYEAGNKDIYRNQATGTIFNHEFAMNDNLDAKFPVIRTKYDRRIRRFLGLLQTSRDILVVRMDRPDQVPATGAENCHRALERLRELFPQTNFDMLYLAMSEGVSFPARTVEALGGGLTRVSFDYRDTTPGVPPFAVMFSQTAAAVAALASVRDYRTSQEKKSFSDKRRQQRWKKYSATSSFECLLARMGIRFRRKYDLIIGFGNACTCSQALRSAGLQHLSFPFDWVVYHMEADDMRKRADLFDDDFANWLNREDIVFRGTGSPRHSTDIYFNTRTQVVLNHDFAKGLPLSETFDAAKEKYTRRIRRMYDCMRKSQKVLVVRLDRPDQKIPTPVDDCSYLRNKLMAKFPGTAFDVLLFNLDTNTLPERAAAERVSDGIMRVAFDYRSTQPGGMPTNVNTAPSRYLKAHFAVRDYRTLRERIAHLGHALFR